jgi:hypothetical protein
MFLDFLNEFEKDIPPLALIFGSARDATQEFLDIQNDHALNLDARPPSLLGPCHSNLTVAAFPKLNQSSAVLHAAIQVEIRSLHASLTNITTLIEEADGSVEAAGSWMYILVIVFCILLSILTGMFATSAYLAISLERKKGKKVNRLFVSFSGSKVAFWVMGLLCVVILYLGTLGLYYSEYFGDLCTDNPDEQVVRLINAQPPMDQFVEWYFSGCTLESRPVILSRVMDIVTITLEQINDLLALVSQLPVLDSICLIESGRSFGEILKDLARDLNRLLVLAKELMDIFECSRVAPLYSHLAYESE